MLQFKPLSPGFGIEASGVDLSQPLVGRGFAELERAFYEHQVLALRAQDITRRAVRRVRAPPRAAAAARDRPVPPSRGLRTS